MADEPKKEPTVGEICSSILEMQNTLILVNGPDASFLPENVQRAIDNFNKPGLRAALVDRLKNPGKYAHAIRIEVESEGVCVRRPATIKVYDGEKLIAEVVARIEKKQGADSGWYDCVELKKLTEEELEFHHLVREFMKGDREAKRILLGDLLHVTKPTIDRWESGESRPYRLVMTNIIGILRNHLNKEEEHDWEFIASRESYWRCKKCGIGGNPDDATPPPKGGCLKSPPT